MFCQYCGKQINEDSRFCQYCGRELNNSGGERSQTEGFRNSQGSWEQPRYQQPVRDFNSIGFNVLSFFFPVIGLILFCIWHGTYPKRAHGIGLWSLIGAGVCIVVTILVFVMILFTAGAGTSGGTFSSPSNQF